MKGERTLDKLPFRYGGIEHDYSKEFHEITGRKGRCWCCGGSMKSINPRLYKSKPYSAVFKITKGNNKGMYRFRPLCRACAYDYGKGVIEANGNTYFKPEDFKENVYLKRLEEAHE